MRTADEIRARLLDDLNHALTHLSMYGGEVAARQLLSDITFVDEREHEFKSHMQVLQDRGAFLSTGVEGAFSYRMQLKPTCALIGSVYAEVAFKMGYLQTKRILTGREFKALKAGLRKTCRTRDMNADDVKAEFGIPSWSVKGNPFYPWVYMYLSNESEDGVIAFDFWNEFGNDPKRKREVYGKYGATPVLQNIRIRGPRFVREFTFTPLGRKIAGRK